MADELDEGVIELGCVYLEGCPMYKRFQDKKALSIWKLNYCTGKFTSCKRYQKRKAGEDVDDHLLPSGDFLRFS